MSKALIPALSAALLLAGCAHAGSPVDLSPPAAPPPRVHHQLPHRVAPPHPVARPVVPHPKPGVHVVPLLPQAPQAAPMAPQGPFEDRWSPAIRDVPGGPVEKPAEAVASDTGHKLHVALLGLLAVLGMGLTAVLVGHRKEHQQP